MIRPPIIWREVRGAVATNHLWFIEIEPIASFGTLAEEVAEWQHKALVWVPCALLGAVLGGFAGWQAVGPLGLLAGLIGLFAGAVGGHNLRSGTRALEYWGKAVHVAAGGNAAALARSLSGYGQFRHAVPTETIKAEIGKRIPRALVWLENNEAALLKIYEARS